MSIANPRYLPFASACEVPSSLCPAPYVEGSKWPQSHDSLEECASKCSVMVWLHPINMTVWKSVSLSPLKPDVEMHIWRPWIFLSGGLIGNKILMKAGHCNGACIKYTDSKIVLQWDSLKVWQLLQGAFKNYIYGNDLSLINLVTILLPNQEEVIL